MNKTGDRLLAKMLGEIPHTELLGKTVITLNLVTLGSYLRIYVR